jgi:predicted nucleotidyltransferase
MRTLDDIMSQLRAMQPDLKRRYPIREMGVFESYARGEQREDSDLDLLVELGDGITLIDYVGLQLELSDALGLTVDMANKAEVRPL